jgi:hypothetical protein
VLLNSPVINVIPPADILRYVAQFYPEPHENDTRGRLVASASQRAFIQFPSRYNQHPIERFAQDKRLRLENFVNFLKPAPTPNKIVRLIKASERAVRDLNVARRALDARVDSVKLKELTAIIITQSFLDTWQSVMSSERLRESFNLHFFFESTVSEQLGSSLFRVGNPRFMLWG